LPRIFDNIDLRLHPALTDTLKISHRADFCVGYFNLRGWKLVDQFVEAWPGGEGSCCRLIVGMSTLPQEELREAFSLVSSPDGLDAQTALRLKKRAAEEFRSQLVLGAPNNADEAGLRRLSAQLKSKKLVVKLFLRYRLHAKLYLIHRIDPNNPATGFLGSSNLTFPGLSKQGELNVDVLDQDACQKLQKWFEDRWDDQWCIDITSELIEILDTSWAREEILPPYHIYLKMAYHLSQEARAGLSEFHVPRDFGNKLLAFQTAAVKIAAQYLNKRGGVVIGDVVGLGKTLMSVALARIFQDDHGTETLIICPKNLVPMWEDYIHQYRMAAKIVPLSTVIRDLPNLARYRVILIDESHNLRNREGRRYKVLQDYIEKNTSKCILLSATPYNKSYIDLSSQLQLFVPADQDLGIRPERLLKEIGETEFIRRHQAPVRSLAAFEKSAYPDDWRDLMRLYLVRRTRGFIKDNYAKADEHSGRKYLTFDSGERFYFPDRVPKTVKFTFNERDPNDPYARLYSNEVVNAVNGLTLPRYGLGNYIAPTPHDPPTDAEAKELAKLSRAGKRLMGFCRTNLFKRLESGGPAFIQSLERHVLRNFVYLHAIENGLPLPIGTQGAEILDAKTGDQDLDDLLTEVEDDQDRKRDDGGSKAAAFLRDEMDFRKRATEIYDRYTTALKSRFKWLRPTLFVDAVRQDLLADIHALIKVIHNCGNWNPAQDAKLSALEKLLNKKYSGQKVLVFTQFADTADYLVQQLRRRGIDHLEGVTGDSENPTAIAWRFSPESNKKREAVAPEDELRVLIATDVLSEGQNLQDCHVIVNYDLPWAIIRLIQRAGRVDRIGQKADTIYCNSFMPADGVERIINLRRRVRQRLQENAEVVGSDESFFEDDRNDQPVIDLYNEKSGILEESDTEVDLASYAYQIWKNAIDANPKLQKMIADLPNVVYSTKQHTLAPEQPSGVLVYMRTADGNDSLAWIDAEGHSVTESQLAILKAAECTPETRALPRQGRHHELVETGVHHMVQEEKSIGGQLGRPSGARFRVYERLKAYATHIQGTLFATQELAKAIDEIYRYPLQQSAADTLNRQLRSGVSDQQLADLVTALRSEARLCRIEEEVEAQEPQIICSLGLSAK
jgi:Helicase conserved C-terminal domain/PLD-like domain/SNF2-related domain